MIQINGQHGGGQILRTALTLSMITGQAFQIKNIRGQRSKPGLMRQHLTCVQAAQQISNATVDGATLHSQELFFEPKKIQSGDYSFSIGSAGSTTLLFQTLLPALSSASSTSTLHIEGGTHNPMAPTADFIQKSFLPQLHKMGLEIDFNCSKLGFAPAGGGMIETIIHPVRNWLPIHLIKRGELQKRTYEILSAHLKPNVVKDEIKNLEKFLSMEQWEQTIRNCNEADSSGNLLTLELQYADHVYQTVSHGKFGKTSSRVVKEAVKAINTFEKSKAAIGTHLADQLLLPLALAKNGSVKVNALTNHIKTNIETIQKMLDIEFSIKHITQGEVLISLAQG